MVSVECEYMQNENSMLIFLINFFLHFADFANMPEIVYAVPELLRLEHGDQPESSELLLEQRNIAMERKH